VFLVSFHEQFMGCALLYPSEKFGEL